MKTHPSPFFFFIKRNPYFGGNREVRYAYVILFRAHSNNYLVSGLVNYTDARETFKALLREEFIKNPAKNSYPAHFKAVFGSNYVDLNIAFPWPKTPS